MRIKGSSVGLYPAYDGKDLEGVLMVDYPEINVIIAETVNFIQQVIPSVESGRELCTIRYEPDHDGKSSIIVPKTEKGIAELAVYDRDWNLQPYGRVEIPMIVVATAAEFPDFAFAAEAGMNARRDEALYMISQIYSKKLEGRLLRADDYLTGFFMSRVMRN